MRRNFPSLVLQEVEHRFSSKRTLKSGYIHPCPQSAIDGLQIDRALPIPAYRDRHCRLSTWPLHSAAVNLSGGTTVLKLLNK